LNGLEFEPLVPEEPEMCEEIKEKKSERIFE
jgi:hypothetical protein